MAEDGAAFGLVAEQGQAGGVLAGAGRARFAALDEAHLLALLGAVEELQPEVGADEGVQLTRGGDDRPRGPGAAGAEEGGDVLFLLARRDDVAVDVGRGQGDLGREGGLGQLRRAEDDVCSRSP